MKRTFFNSKGKDKQYIVIGCGRFGSSVAKKMCQLGNEVMVIDKDEDSIENIAEQVTHTAIVDVTEERDLKSIGLDFGLSSYNPSISDKIINKSASNSLATSADNLSLSEKQTCISSLTYRNATSKVDTVSFWLITGTTPSSNNLLKVVLKLKYLLRTEKSSSVKRI